MKLSERLRDAREAAQKKIQDAKGLSTKYSAEPNGANYEAFQRAAADAAAATQACQAIEMQLQLEQNEATIDPAAPSATDRLAQSLAGDAGIVMPRGPDFQAMSLRMGRKLDAHGYRERFGMSAEAHDRAFSAYIRQGKSVTSNGHALMNSMRAITQLMGAKDVDEKWLHRIVDDSLGGFLVGEDIRTQIIKAIPGYTVVRRAGASVINTNKTSVRFPVVNRATANDKQYSSDLTQLTNWKQSGYVSGGTAPTVQSKPTFGMEEIPVHDWQPDAIEITQDLLDDADIDLDSLLVNLISETYGQDTDYAFLRGNGNGMPEGILNGGAASVTVGSAATYATPVANNNGFTYQGIVDLFTDLAAQYRQDAVWIMNSNTYGRLLGLLGSDGQPLFPVNALPGTLFNRPMYFTEFLDKGNTSGNKPIIFGSMRHYFIVERRNLGIMRLAEKYAPNIGLLPVARVGGHLTLPEAFRLGNTAA